MNKENIKSIIGLLMIIFFFLLSAYLIQNNLLNLNILMDYSFLGMLIYILILITATVLAPLNAMPLIPIASNLWGWFLAAILSIIGWTFGAIIAFSLARQYGLPLVRKFIPHERLIKFEKLIPQKNAFWTIVLLRIAVPVDILSYALRLFTNINLSTYIIATIIGISPFAFIFAYAGALSIKYQIIAIIFASIILIIAFLIQKTKSCF